MKWTRAAKTPPLVMGRHGLRGLIRDSDLEHLFHFGSGRGRDSILHSSMSWSDPEELRLSDPTFRK